VANDRGAGPAQEALTFGARLVVIGYLLRDAAQIRASFPAYREDTRGPNLVDVVEIRRVDNSWSWQQGSRVNCTRQ
jgi:hypothetical protein